MPESLIGKVRDEARRGSERLLLFECRAADRYTMYTLLPKDYLRRVRCKYGAGLRLLLVKIGSDVVWIRQGVMFGTES